MRVCVAALVSCALATSAVAAPPTVLEPKGRWVVDYTNDTCRLLREFVDGEQRAMLVFEQGAPSENFSLTAASPRLERFVNDRPVLYRFNDTREATDTYPLHGTLDKIGKGIIYSALNFSADEEMVKSGLRTDYAKIEEVRPALPEIDIEEAGKAGFLAFRQGRQEVIFKTGAMNAPMAALNRCVADLVRHWGHDVEQLRTATRGPVWVNGRSIARRIAGRYPAKALEDGEQGILRMLIDVDATGQVENCRIMAFTKQQSLESPACEEMRKARFEPALDAAGQPMRSFYATTIVYRVG